MSVLAPVAPKLAKLIPMLSSDKEGEVLATVDAIRRTLRSELTVSPWEQEFVKSIIRQVADAPNLRISAKQISVLDRLLERLQEAA